MRVQGMSLFALVVVTAMASQAARAESPTLSVLSYRTAESLAPLLAGFTEATGIAVALDVRSADAIVDVFRAPRPDVDPDLVISVDALRFDAMAALGAFRPLPADVLARVPVSMRDPAGQWVGLSWRIRAPFHRPGVAPVADLSALAAHARAGRFCTRPADHVYNLGVVAWLVAREGEAVAETWARAVFGTPALVDGGDSVQAMAVVDGRCDVALVNHYYVARLRQSEDEAVRAAATAGHFGYGVPDAPVIANVSAIALPRRSARPEAAEALARWLVRAEALRLHAEIFSEFPAGWPELDGQLPKALQPMRGLRPAPPFPDTLAKSVPVARRILDAALEQAPAAGVR